MEAVAGEEHVVSNTFTAFQQPDFYVFGIVGVLPYYPTTCIMGLPAVRLDKSGKSALDGGLCLSTSVRTLLCLTGFAPAELQRIVGNFRYHFGVGVYCGFAYTCVPPIVYILYSYLVKIKINISFYPLY